MCLVWKAPDLNMQSVLHMEISLSPQSRHAYLGLYCFNSCALLLSVLMFSATLNAKTISLSSYLVYVHISTEDTFPQTIKLYAAKTEFNIFTVCFSVTGIILIELWTQQLDVNIKSRQRRQIKQDSFTYFIHEFIIISVSVTRGIKYFLVVDSVPVAFVCICLYMLQLSIVSQHKHETIKIMTAWYSFATSPDFGLYHAQCTYSLHHTWLGIL